MRKLAQFCLPFILLSCSHIQSKKNLSLRKTSRSIAKVKSKTAYTKKISKRFKKLKKQKSRRRYLTQRGVSRKSSAPLRKRSIIAKRKKYSKKSLSKKNGGLNLRSLPKDYKFWKEYFYKKRRPLFERYLTRGENYREIIESIFIKHGLPKELFFVGVIESGYRINAKSTANAVGPWQFIKGTATRYGLKVNSHQDERLNIYKSTEAAASYFKDLYNIFGRWDLALCAYNAGEYRIINAIRKGNTRDYKELARRKLIPKETILYVPKVEVAIELAKKIRPKIDLDKKDLFAQSKLVNLRGPLNLSEMLKRLRVPRRIFDLLNPDLIRRPRRLRSANINVALPSHVNEMALNNWGSNLRNSRGTKRAPAYVRAKRKIRNRYKVSKGDNLFRISRRFNIPVSRLKTLNGINNQIYVGQVLKLKSAGRLVYRVRKGDSLARIARRFGVTLKALLRQNRLKNGNIRPNQRLYIPSRG